MSNHIIKKDPVTDTIPKEWLSEQEMIAKESLRVLYREYKGWKWGVEWTVTTRDSWGQLVIGMLVIRLMDVPTEYVYTIQHKDIDIDRMTCVRTAGGMLLEAHGIKPGAARGDQIRGLKKTPAGLIVPDYAAMPEHNPGYARCKSQQVLLK